MNRDLPFLRGHVGFRVLSGLALLLFAVSGAMCLKSRCGGEKPADPAPAPGVLEAMADARELLKPAQGARVIAADQAVAGAWDGEFVPLPPDRAGVEAKIGKGGYVVVDDFSMRRKFPGLKPLLTGADPLPGAGLVYRRYLREQDRLVSIYQWGAPPFSVTVEIAAGDPDARAEKLIVEARELYGRGYLEHARRALEAVVAAKPKLALAHRELMKVYMALGYFDRVSLQLAEEELVKYGHLAGPGADTGVYGKTMIEIRQKHDAFWGGK